MWAFLCYSTVSSFISGCGCAIGLYTGKTPLKLIRGKNDKSSTSSRFG